MAKPKYGHWAVGTRDDPSWQQQKTRIREVDVEMGNCGRDGNGRNLGIYFVPARDFPTRPAVGFCSRRLPPRRKVSRSRPDCSQPSHYLLSAHRLFRSYPDVRTQFIPSRFSLLGQIFPARSPPVFWCSHDRYLVSNHRCNWIMQLHFRCNNSRGDWRLQIYSYLIFFSGCSVGFCGD